MDSGQALFWFFYKDAAVADNPETPLKLPIGAADFSEFIAESYYCSDKTEFLCQLARQEKPYFLSRPRGLGKTLLADTLENILRGRRELFKGQWIGSSDCGWTPHPVIRLGMSGLKRAALN